MRVFSKQPRTVVNRAHHGNTANELRDLYNARKAAVADATPVEDMSPEAIYANNELNLSDIKVMGFDYDYTVATYTSAVHKLLFDLGKSALVNNVKYPAEIMDLEFDPSFAVRGLHFDVQKGLMMKIDGFHSIQLGTVYRGLQPVPDDEVISLYGGIHIPVDYLEPSGPLHQLVDLFAIPEISLVSLIIEHFVQNNIEYDPEYVFNDIQNAVQGIHKSGKLHQNLMDNLELYLEKTVETKGLLERLREEGKNLFLITNSGFPFINAGMRHMIGAGWLDLFDIVIVRARKPKFFHLGNRPFRLYDPVKETNSWGRVTTFERGKVYQQGNLCQLHQMTGWFGPQVLYFGDHVYTDLADPSLRFGWRTGAIVPELEREIEVYNSADYKAAIRWLVVLEHMIENLQHQDTADSRKVIAEWREERNRQRLFAKSINNPYFGSLFRTYHNPTYFFRRLARFADVYMSSLTNLLHYPSDYTFYPHRMVLPHEPSPFQHLLNV
ncbi:5'-nucleotidase domain-containing protein 2-like [Babylonia areolata]|uniref:5'-nucleotidase domain-containing protein 2-like n=1 Tax=Babylonia areolata TaxID=304850 RepID=UPI003FD2F111